MDAAAGRDRGRPAFLLAWQPPVAMLRYALRRLALALVIVAVAMNLGLPAFAIRLGWVTLGSSGWRLLAFGLPARWHPVLPAFRAPC
jgi:hypothetical protein